MDATILRLATYVHGLNHAQIPARAAHEARRRIVDSVACAAAASTEPFCAKLVQFAAHYSGTPSARIWGAGQATSVEMATFVNGTLLRYLDFSDTVLARSNGHPSDMLGGLIAVAEAYRLNGQALITSVVAAYEIYCSLCVAVPMAAKAVDQGTAAAVGTAAGVASLLGLSVQQTANALSLALASNVHLFNVRSGELSDWKGCAGPNGARNGVFAAMLAREGITGPTAPVEGKGGLQTILGAFDWQPRTHGEPLIVQTHLKFHPVCYHGQSAVDAALALREKVNALDIRSVDIETYEAAYSAMGKDPQRWAPANRETADHSLPYAVAMAWIHGKLASDSYETERLACQATRELMSRIAVTSQAELTAEFPANTSCRIRVRDEAGREFEHLQSNPKGNAANPLSDAELESKFVDLFAAWGDERKARALLSVLWSADQSADCSRLVDELCAAQF